MAEDTAVLEPESVVAEEQAPDLDPETDSPEALAQTDGEEDEGGNGEDAEEQPLSKDEVDALIKEREEALRKEFEAERNRELQEAEEKAQQATYTAQLTQAVRDRQGEAHRALSSMLKWAFDQGENGKEFAPNPQVVDALSQRLERMAFHAEWQALAQHGTAYITKLAPKYRPSQESAAKVQRALVGQDPAQMTNALLDQWFEAARESVRDEVRAEIERESAEAGKTAALRDAEAKRKAQAKPTNVTGAGAPGRDDAAIVADPSASEKERRAAFKRLYGFDM